MHRPSCFLERFAVPSWLLALLALLALSCSRESSERTASKAPAEPVKEEAKRCSEPGPACLPPIDFKDVEGKVWTHEELVGKVVVINFWATWCAPCQVEVPDLAEAQRKYKDQGVLVFGMLAEELNKPVLEAFQKRFGLDYPVIPVTKTIFESFGEPRAMPTNLVYSRTGHLAFTALGALDLAGLEQALQDLL